MQRSDTCDRDFSKKKLVVAGLDPAELQEKKASEMLTYFSWYTLQDSNLRPSVPKTDALSS